MWRKKEQQYTYTFSGTYFLSFNTQGMSDFSFLNDLCRPTVTLYSNKGCMLNTVDLTIVKKHIKNNYANAECSYERIILTNRF